MFDVGAKLRKIRKKANLTLDQLAASSGVDRGTISRIELGHVSPRIDTIAFLSEALGTDLASFFGAVPAPRSTDLDGLAETTPEELNQRMHLAMPKAQFPSAEMEGYWPVPSTFWHGLLEVLERIELLVKNSSEMILVQDRAGTILYASPPCEAILGLRSSELVGLKGPALVHPEDLPGYTRALEDLPQEATSTHQATFRMLHKDGSWRRICARLTNQLHNPSIRAVIFNALEVRTRVTQAREPAELV